MFAPLLRAALVIVVLMASIQALSPVFAATHNGDNSRAAGAGTISGFVISDIAYHLSDDDQGNLDAVIFTATAASRDSVATPASISVWFDSESVHYACTRTGGANGVHHIFCDTSSPHLKIINMNAFHVAITQ